MMRIDRKTLEKFNEIAQKLPADVIRFIDTTEGKKIRFWQFSDTPHAVTLTLGQTGLLFISYEVQIGIPLHEIDADKIVDSTHQVIEIVLRIFGEVE